MTPRSRRPDPVPRPVLARSALTVTGIPGFDWCLNPYVGCAHACRYCYAVFMARFRERAEPWGSFVDAKANLPEVLLHQVRRVRPGPVVLSSVTDPYQPAEKRLGITRRCLQVLQPLRYPLSVLTKSPLVTRDIDLLTRFREVEVGLTISTDDERMREVFEPGAPPIAARLEALRRLSAAGLSTYAFIGPLLPSDPGRLAAMVASVTGSVLVDRMNYVSRVRGLYRSLGLERWLEDDVSRVMLERLRECLADRGVSVGEA